MKCPKCHNPFEHITTAMGDIERCTACKGLWLDSYEIEDMKPLAKDIDIGHKSLGKRFNEIDKVECPVCPNNPLLRMVDAKQPHIWYESCPTCKGRFYDAGEFTDLASVDLTDFFKRFLVKART